MNATETSDFVSEIKFRKVIEWGGFKAAIRGESGSIFLWATAWRGSQPRLILQPRDAGYADWKRLVETLPGDPTTHRFVGAARAAANADDQWITHQPSPLLTD